MEENIITSVQNARIKHVVALQQKSSLRREEGLFVVEGQREIEHCLEGGYEVVEVFSRKEEGVRRQESGVRREVEYLVTPQVYEKMAYRGSTEGIIAVVKSRDHTLSSFLFPPS
ncbi:MAG: RNA methyltransferase, partial [Prevotella sp.]|nr:RNA methyltransferase [Prevotella sp.]